MTKSNLVDYEEWKREQSERAAAPTQAPAIAAATPEPVPTRARADIPRPGSAGTVFSADMKTVQLPSGERCSYVDASLRGYRVEQMPECTGREEIADHALQAFGDTPRFRAFMQGLPTASATPEVERPVQPVKTLSLFDRVAMKAKELRAEDRSARDHEFGRALAYACDLSRSQRIEIRQALQMCGVDPSRI